jgi:hypothetical protein
MTALLILCTCAPLTAREALDRSDAVFEGKVLETAPQETPSRAECAPPGPGAGPPAAYKGGCLDGFVWSARNCSPVSGAPVVAKPEEGEAVTGVTGADGHYQICDLAPGAYRLEASFDFARKEEAVNVVQAEVRVVHFSLELSPNEKARFEVTRAYKGLVQAEREVMVITNKNSAACGYGSFQVGESYVVYASRQRGNLYTGLCDGTKPVDKAQVDLGVLRAPRKGGCAGCAAARGDAPGGALAILALALMGALARSRPGERGGGGSRGRARGRRPRSAPSSRRSAPPARASGPASPSDARR